MRTRSFSLALLSVAAIFGAAACNKDKATIEATTSSSEVITATVAKNTTYTYNLASSASRSTNYAVIDGSDAGASVDISTVQNVPVFEYVPATDFVGTDLVQVVAVTDSLASGDCGNGGRNGDRVHSTDMLTFQMQVTETGS